MGKLTQFTINLNQNVYYPGQWIQGHVIVNLSQDMKMRGIQLELHGGADVHWTETHTTGSGRTSTPTTRHYGAKETYFNNKLLLYGNFSDSTVHPAGYYTYPVQFQLPSTLPTSFEGTIGRVRYWARCVIKRPWKFDHKTKIAFTVASNLDLNSFPDVLTCPQGQNSKTLCCLCCASAPIEAVVRLDRKGYVPGENILVSAEVTNGSSRKMDCTKAVLIQRTTFHATTKSRLLTARVAELRKGVVQGGQSITWNNEAVLIPPLPVSYLSGCKIIDIRYILKFVVDPSGPASDLEVPLEVVIGGIPLQTYFTAYSAAAANAGQAMAGEVYYLPPAANNAEPSATSMSAGALAQPPLPPSAPPGAPPPSYRASVFGKVNIMNDEGDNEHTRGNTNYAPSYPYYNWDSSAYSLPV